VYDDDPNAEVIELEAAFYSAPKPAPEARDLVFLTA
tara:strand:- start:1062 stop:1169 length:108 start_codon:yes stop_codon:yes gene_type:complete